jgi:NAD(P)-dependent dehydrogenase (short-subunit alcohol dehydrogenase family)
MDAGRSGWGLEGRGFIVIGAAQGIGEATARAFADVGACVPSTSNATGCMR